MNTTSPTRQFSLSQVRQAVRTLAEFVSDERGRPTQAVVEALEIYNAACRLVNERLDDCRRLVKIGQRSEALRQIQIEPDALTLYDKPNQTHPTQLDEVCEEFELTPPAPLDTESAAALNEAYGLEKSQRELLREHRLLALDRAPIPQRLIVLRQIQQESPSEFFWQDDIAALEEKRIAEIRKLVADHRSMDDWQTVSAIHQECEASSDWQTPQTKHTQHTIKKCRTRLMRKGVQEKLEPLLEQLNPAMFDEDVERVERIVAEAAQLQEEYELDDDSKLLEPMHDAAEWVRQRKVDDKQMGYFNEAVRELQDALTNGMEWYYVQQYYFAANKYGIPLPEEVQTLFRMCWVCLVLFLAVGSILGVIILLIVVTVVLVKFK